MPYRNALRDNFDRFQQANDAEMRMYASQRMQQAQPQGQYAGFSLGDLARIIQGEAPQEYVPEQAQMEEQPQFENTGYNPEEGGDAIRRRRAELAAALQQVPE